jgi:hypothetical protein
MSIEYRFCCDLGGNNIKNKYVLNDNQVIIELNRRNGEKYYTIINLDDFNKVDSYNVTWFPKWMPTAHSYYASASLYLGANNGKYKYKPIYIHKIIMDVDNKYVIDHRNNNTLDNRKDNLRKTEQNNNLKNRKGANLNNKSGYRNVCWIEKEHCYWVQLQIDGKNKRLGKFSKDELLEAAKFAEEMREKYYGEFKGIS